MLCNAKNLASLLTGALASAVLASAAANAGEAREETPGYAQDSSSNVVTTGSGDCLQTGSWKSDMANVVGCDGVTLDVKIEVIEGAPSGLIGAVAIPDVSLFAFDSADLSEQRARAVRDYLVSNMGVDASKIVTVGAGESMPVASNTTEEGRAENRRVDVMVLGRAKM